MKNAFAVLLLAAWFLALAPGLQAQPAACSEGTVQGVYMYSCNGFSDLSLYDPRVPPKTFVPYVSTGRATNDGRGEGSAAQTVNVGGTAVTSKLEGNYKVSADCTGDFEFWDVTQPAAKSRHKGVVQLDGQEIVSINLGPSPILCVFKRIGPSWWKAE